QRACMTSRPIQGAARRGRSHRVELVERLLDLVGLVDLLEELAYLGRPEATMTTQRADRRDLAGAGPTRDRLGIHPEHRGDFGRREQLFGFGSGILGHVVLA